MRFSTFILATTLTLATSPSLAQPTDPSGIDFVTITHPNNPAWAGNGTPGDIAIGRGSVSYEYRIGRIEVTTSQWAEFMNAALDRPSNDRIPFVFAPTAWGASGTAPNNPGGQRFTVQPQNAMLPAGGIDWRTCAIYCNWLHNDKGTSREAFLNGAYDVSTFGYIGNIFTDQFAHHPDAKYWIPTWDEWLKAAHWSPSNPNQNGWYTYSNGTNSPLVAGPPGSGQANFGFSSPNPFSIPLGAYQQTQSPWGLFDVAGGTSEWTESIRTLITGDMYRYFDGSYWNSSPGQSISDSIYALGAEAPSVASYNFGFRIATSIPSPGSCVPITGVVILGSCRRSRRSQGAFHEEVGNAVQLVRRSWQWR